MQYFYLLNLVRLCSWDRLALGSLLFFLFFILFYFFFTFFLIFKETSFFNLFIYFWLCWVFISVQGVSLVAASGGHSSSWCTGLSLSRPLLLPSTGSRRAGSVAVAHGPSRSAACGIFPDQGSNPCPLHWQADSQPLHHQGNPIPLTDVACSPRCSCPSWMLGSTHMPVTPGPHHTHHSSTVIFVTTSQRNCEDPNEVISISSLCSDF